MRARACTAEIWLVASTAQWLVGARVSIGVGAEGARGPQPLTDTYTLGPPRCVLIWGELAEAIIILIQETCASRPSAHSLN